MAVPIIALSGAFAPEAAGKWEEEAYQEGCAVARGKAVAYLRGLEKQLEQFVGNDQSQP